MGLRIALVSGGKDSYYAVYRCGFKIDLGVMFVYEFPRPSPHIVNLGKSVETFLLIGVPVLVAKLKKGCEFDETVNLIKRLEADAIVAGDVYIEEHLKYMERVSRETGATLIEPLWGMEPEELVYEEFESGMKTVVIGCLESLSRWIGKEVSLNNVGAFVEEAKKVGVDPLGERGEYHTLVVDGPLHTSPLRYRILDRVEFDGYVIIRLS